MSQHAIVVPDIGDYSDVPVIEVLVKVGDAIEKEQPLIVLESDKATMEVPADQAGIVTSLTIKVGDKVSKGSVIGQLPNHRTLAYFVAYFNRKTSDDTRLIGRNLHRRFIGLENNERLLFFNGITNLHQHFNNWDIGVIADIRDYDRMLTHHPLLQNSATEVGE